MSRVTAIATVERPTPSVRFRSIYRCTYQNSITAGEPAPFPHKLMTAVVVGPDMTASLAASASSLPLQAGLLASQAGQLLVALVAVALVIVVGKFVLKLAWRLVTIGIVLVAAFFLLSTVGVI